MLNRYRIPDLRHEIEFGRHGILPEDIDILIHVSERMLPDVEDQLSDDALDKRCNAAHFNWLDTLNN